MKIAHLRFFCYFCKMNRINSDSSSVPPYRDMAHDPRRVLFMLALIILLACGSLCRQAWAQNTRPQKATEKTTDYNRPKPTKPLKPAIPSQNRYQSDKVFLEKADSLVRRNDADSLIRQIVKGDVVFRQGGMWMYCDSAYYYADRNSMDAFGHVRMVQGDTLFVYADKLFYDGDIRLARLFRGPTESKVKLKDPQGTLLTDTLYYDLGLETGSYDCGGELTDNQNVLTSLLGQYNTSTHDAEFYRDVELVNRRDGYRLLSDTLLYNTRTGIARICSPTRIYGQTDTILTSFGWYDTRTDNLQLTSRSTIAHTDSAGNVTTIEGDSIVYDKRTRISRAFAFNRPGGRQMVLTDTAHKMILTGLFGLYNDSTREALSTGYPLLKEYSRPDTIYLRADTIRTAIATIRVWPDSLKALAWKFRPADTELEVFEDEARVLPPMTAEDSLALDSSLMTDREVHIARAYHRARFFNRDIQGVADSMVFMEQDSMVRMFHKPIIWSGERQISGGSRRSPGELFIHFNDSTADWALLPSSGLMTEQVDSADFFYNQLAGKKMKAWFENRTLRHLDVSGNTQTLFLPMEEDSTYNRLVLAEASYLTVDMTDGELDRVKMWPEVKGNVTPIFLVTPRQKVLEGYEGRIWLPAIRPRGILIGDRMVWDDDLGEVSPELETYFETSF